MNDLLQEKNFYVDFMKLFEELKYEFQRDYYDKAIKEAVEKEEIDYVDIDYEVCMSLKNKGIKLVLRKMIVLIWKNLSILNKFSKEELYMVLNCVKLAKSENIKSANFVSKKDIYREIEENYQNSR